VDASSSWGIGVVVGSYWDAWRLLFEWKSEGQDIGWAEAVTVKLAMLWLVESSWQDTCIKIHCDNSSVISSFWKGCSHNPWHNDCHSYDLVSVLL